MDTPSTVIILAVQALATATSSASDDGIALQWHSVITQVQRALTSQLPTVLVAPGAMLSTAHDWTNARGITTASLDTQSPGAHLASGLRVGVQMSATANGWIMLPVGLGMLQDGTLNRISDLLQQHPIAYPTHRNQQGLPIGFGRELFSELMQLRSDRDLHRLVNRYPSQGIELDDPGALIHPWVGHDGSAEDRMLHSHAAVTEPQRPK